MKRIFIIILVLCIIAFIVMGIHFFYNPSHLSKEVRKAESIEEIIEAFILEANVQKQEDGTYEVSVETIDFGSLVSEGKEITVDEIKKELRKKDCDVKCYTFVVENNSEEEIEETFKDVIARDMMVTSIRELDKLNIKEFPEGAFDED